MMLLPVIRLLEGQQTFLNIMMKRLLFAHTMKRTSWRRIDTKTFSRNSLDSFVRDPLVGLNDEHRKLFLNAFEFGRQHFAPNAIKWDEKSVFPRSLMGLCAEQGYGGWISSTEMGGRNWSKREMVVAVEALSNFCVSTTAMLTIHNACVSIIDKFSQSPHREHWVPKLCKMETMASFCLTEPGSGSDAASLITKATIDESSKEYVINGEKCFISGAGMSDLYVVMCRTAPNAITAIVVPNGTPGLSFGSNEKKMGWRNQPTRQVKFEDVRVPFSHRLGREGQGFKIAMAGLDGGRLNIAACSIGAANACLNIVLSHMKDKNVTQDQSFLIADMFGKIHSARVLLRQAADLLDQNHPTAAVQCAFAKQVATDYGSAVCGDAMQLLGPIGLLQETQVERFTRDVRVHQILEGTNEIMRHIVGRALVG